MAMIKCPECGREISTMAPACPGCGILKEDIQKLLGTASGNQKPLPRKSRKMLTCVACHQENEEGISSVCEACGYPLLSLSSNKKQVKKAVESYKRRETEKTPEKPVQVTDTLKKPEPGPVKPTPQIPPTGKKSGKAIVAAVVVVACVVVCVGLFSKKKLESEPVVRAERTISTVSESTESDTASVVTTSSYFPESVISDSLGSSSELEYTGIPTSSTYYDIGDTIKFGYYEQDNNPSNGKEKIEWTVLDKDEEGYLLISKYGLDVKYYTEDLEDVTWETCTLRSWLNEDFYYTAFLSDARQKIRTTHVIAEKNPDYDTEPGNDTDDSVFLLSIEEAENYFDSDEARKVYPTEYAKANGAYEDSSTRCCYWHLRSPGGRFNYTAFVSSAGKVYHDDHSLDSGEGCVRPAIWVNL